MYTLRMCQQLCHRLYGAMYQRDPCFGFTHLFKRKHGYYHGVFRTYNLWKWANPVNVFFSKKLWRDSSLERLRAGGCRSVHSLETQTLTHGAFGEGGGTVGRVEIGRRLVMPVKIGCESNPGYELDYVHGLTASTRAYKTNQDAYCVHTPFNDDRKQMFVGVFDGHGIHGARIAQMVRDKVPRLLPRMSQVDPRSPGVTAHAVMKDRRNMLKLAFETVEKVLVYNREIQELDHYYSGTAAVCLWMLGREAYCAWTGDCRCVVGRRESGSQGRSEAVTFQAIEMSDDHKAKRSDEQERVKKAGGRIMRWQRSAGPLRVWMPDDWVPGLAMTRTIGDTLISKYGVTPHPDVTHIVLSDDDLFIVLASDGVWEFMSSEEVIHLVGRMRMDRATPKEAANALAREAERRWRQKERLVDDITAVVIWLDFKRHSKTKSKRLSGSKIAKRRKSGRSEPHLINERGFHVPFKSHSKR